MNPTTVPVLDVAHCPHCHSRTQTCAIGCQDLADRMLLAPDDLPADYRPDLDLADARAWAVQAFGPGLAGLLTWYACVEYGTWTAVLGIDPHRVYLYISEEDTGIEAVILEDGGGCPQCQLSFRQVRNAVDLLTVLDGHRPRYPAECACN